MSNLSHILRSVLLSGLILLFLNGSGLQAAEFSPAEVKVAFVYNFAKFTSWPESGKHHRQQHDLRLGLLGSNNFGPALRQIFGRKVHNRTLKVVNVQTLDEARQCQLLFIGTSEKGRLNDLLPGLWGHPTLTISDIPGFAAEGGMIELRLVDKRQRFLINLKPVRHARLHLNAQMLKLALDVIEETL